MMKSPSPRYSVAHSNDSVSASDRAVLRLSSSARRDAHVSWSEVPRSRLAMQASSIGQMSDGFVCIRPQRGRKEGRGGHGRSAACRRALDCVVAARGGIAASPTLSRRGNLFPVATLRG